MHSSIGHKCVHLFDDDKIGHRLMLNLHVTDKCLFNARNLISFRFKRTPYTNSTIYKTILMPRARAHINCVFCCYCRCHCRLSGMYNFISFYIFFCYFFLFLAFLVSFCFILLRFVYTCVYCVCFCKVCWLLTTPFHTSWWWDLLTLTLIHSLHSFTQPARVCSLLLFLSLLWGESQS